MSSIKYTGNKKTDYKLNSFAQIEIEKLDNPSEEKIKALIDKTDDLSRDLAVNDGIFIRSKKIEVPDSQISDLKLHEISQRVKSRNGEMYFSDLDESSKPLSLSRTQDYDGNPVIRLEFSSDPTTMSFIYTLQNDKLFNSKELPEITSQTPSFSVDNPKEIWDEMQKNVPFRDIKKMSCQNFVDQKPELRDIYRNRQGKPQRELSELSR